MYKEIFRVLINILALPKFFFSFFPSCHSAFKLTVKKGKRDGGWREKIVKIQTERIHNNGGHTFYK